MQQIDQFKATFFQECDELLTKLEEHLAGLSSATDVKEELNAAFRAIHSIKGGAAMFGFARLVCFAHIFESALDSLRSGRTSVTDELVEIALQATDILTDLASAARTGKVLADGFETAAREQLEQSFLAGGEKSVSKSAAPEAKQSSANQAGAMKHFRIVFEPSAEMLRRAVEPLVLIRNLGLLGELKVAADTAKLPAFEDLDPALCYLAWTFDLKTIESAEAVHEVFQFVSGSGLLDIQQVAVKATQPDAPAKPKSSPEAYLAKAVVENTQTDRRISSIRVDLDRVERLVDLVGEITIAQAMVLQHLDQSMIDSNSSLFRALSQLLQHSRNLQDGVMAIRAQPIRSIFARMPRVAREACQMTGRQVQIELTGEDTEIDKTIIEQLADPLMHIVRNSIDHGIESQAERRAAGKPDIGQLKLTAAQRGGRIVVEIIDDGRGINRKAVLARAIENKIVAPDAELTDDEINNLIFSPGLSTARTVSGLSGRGVGMDVVQQNILKLGGRVSVKSQAGVGTTTTITLPLTLAVLDGMLIRAGDETYLIPLNNIVECLSIQPRDLKPVAGSGMVIVSRGRHIPAVNVARHFAGPKDHHFGQIQIVVAELETGGLVGLIVSEIVGHSQVVIKSIRQNYRDVPGIAGATILGDGNVALILDVTQLAALSSDREQQQFKAQLTASLSETYAA